MADSANRENYPTYLFTYSNPLFPYVLTYPDQVNVFTRTVYFPSEFASAIVNPLEVIPIITIEC